MTNLFFRVQRNGSWESVELEHCTPEERQEQFAKIPRLELVRWLDAVCDTLAELDRAFKEQQAADTEPPQTNEELQA